MKTLSRQIVRSAVVLCLSCGIAQALEFQLSFPGSVRNEPFTGRVYLLFGQGNSEPRRGPDWFHPAPFCALDVENWHPDSTLVVTPQTPGLVSFPRPLAETSLTGFKVQAVARFNPRERRVGTGAGNAFSAVATTSDNGPCRLLIEHLVSERPFEETAERRLLQVPSELLTAFHGYPVTLQAGILLPASYGELPQRRYPVIIDIPGFGGTHFDVARWSQTDLKAANGVEFILVVPDPSCPLGHHVFADSANNGPWGTAFVKEFLPVLDQTFRTTGESSSRFLTGHSSGGWSSLWLQISHPEEFGGTWSTAPDPVDFRDFQRINVYEDASLYRTAAGERRPLARLEGETVLWFEDFCRMEETLGPGGQLHSFEAVFSPRNPQSGRPLLLWDRETGQIDHQVARSWQRYDIVHQLTTNWPRLGPRLAGKLHVIMGTEDTFYLEGATRRLQQVLQELGSDAVIELSPGKNHFNLLTPELRQRMTREMAASLPR